MLLGFEVDHTAATRMLDGIEHRLDQPRALLQLMGEEISDYESDLFATAGHGTWAPLSAATVRAKGNGRILVDTGNLLNSLTGQSAVRVSGDDVIVATDVAYAKYLKAGSRGAPPRDPAQAPSSSDTRRWATKLLDAIVDGHL